MGAVPTQTLKRGPASQPARQTDKQTVERKAFIYLLIFFLGVVEDKDLALACLLLVETRAQSVNQPLINQSGSP